MQISLTPTTSLFMFGSIVSLFWSSWNLSCEEFIVLRLCCWVKGMTCTLHAWICPITATLSYLLCGGKPMISVLPSLKGLEWECQYPTFGTCNVTINQVTVNWKICGVFIILQFFMILNMHLTIQSYLEDLQNQLYCHITRIFYLRFQI